jgi:hypothetical protein
LFFSKSINDDCHLNYIAKLQKEKKKSTHWADPTRIAVVLKEIDYVVRGYANN